MFVFKGPVLASKSWMNRALVIQHFNPGLQVIGSSTSDDVAVLQKALQKIPTEKSFYLGQGGTSLRFFAFAASRHTGDWALQAHARLLERPQVEIKEILNQLGVQVEFSLQEIKVKSTGWTQPKNLFCKGDISSQFISGLLLSSWNLDFDLHIEIQKPVASEDYLKMTIDLLQKAGMTVNQTATGIHIPPQQKASAKVLQAELDVSSAFSLVTAAVIDGDVEITNWNSNSTQPDMAFLKIFQKMNITYQQDKNYFRIQKQAAWQGCEENLNQSPDLFPVLSVLCALAQGKSHLFGAAQLKFKESDRLQKTKELLDLCGFQSTLLDDGLKIDGLSSTKNKDEKIYYNPDHDHRMAMAAALLKLAGYNIQIETPDVINKSYPQFWQDIGVQP